MNSRREWRQNQKFIQNKIIFAHFMKKEDKLDVVFVVGPVGRRVNREISRIARQLTRSVSDCRVASIHFESKYDSQLCKEVFYGRVFDFSNVYVNRSKCANGLIQGNPLQLVTGLSFRDDAARICFLISSVLPFNDSYEGTLIHDNGERLNVNNEDLGQTNTTEGIPTEQINDTFVMAGDSTTENTVNDTTNTAENSAIINDTNSDGTAPGNTPDVGNSNTNKEVNQPDTDKPRPDPDKPRPDPDKPRPDPDKPRPDPDTANSAGTTVSHPKNTQVYNEDPLQICRLLAAMGVVLYCIETNPYSTIYKDMYEALVYITGGQYINTNTLQISKVVKCAIVEEVSLERLASYVRDYLCIAWLAWGRKKARKPSSIEELSENLLNYLHNVNIHTPELLVGEQSLKPPSKHAKKIAGLNDISEARKMRVREEEWAAELSWLAVEACNEVIPGYDTEASRNQAKKVTISELKRVTRNQAARILVRTLTRRPGMYRKQQQQEQTVQKTEIAEKGQSYKIEPALDSNDKEWTEKVTQEKEKLNDIPSSEQLTISCKQDLLIIEKHNCGQDQMCVLV